MKLSRRHFVLASLASQVRLRGAVSSSDGAWLQDVRPGKATLVWRGGAGEGWAEWECAGAEKKSVKGVATALPDGGTLWKASLEGLAHGGEVQYSAGKHSGRFRSQQEGPSPLRFLAFGDSGCGSEEQLALAQRMEAEAADLLLHTGDIAYPISTDAALEELYFGAYRGLMGRMPFYPCPGNHDYVDDLGPYLRWHALPGEQGTKVGHEGRYYRFETKGVEFFSLDSNDPLWEGKAMLDWLDARLAASRAFWRIVYFHHPPYTAGKHATDETCKLAAELLAPRLERSRIPLVLNGHDHNYQRSLSGDTTYLVTGGGGAWLYEAEGHERLQMSGNWHHYLRAAVDGWKMRVEAVGLDGRVLDEVQLAPGAALRSVVNAAGFEARLAPRALVSIFGYHLAALGRFGVKVSLDGESLPILGAAGGQLNVLMPSGGLGRKVLAIETPNGASSIEVEILRAAPALFRDAAGRPLTSEPGSVGTKVKLYLTGSGGERMRLRTGLTDLGEFVARPTVAMAGVEEIEVPLPVGWEDLRVETVI